ncbi:SDR family NAD(P)-dependent oxidoreductase [Rhizobium sp. XQZ8]|uniref:SDR family NAD(P)-dependent oxidoreductase n=1 Tax=Rhizobium populisoli TaxID=2859785 RepID=UPI001CA4F25A|nr:SDR family NAD(P)-dependent oxidoreductase [Rhizobium populisoli]MBW6425201.1 SDR family NAD(P)-dependent oxidoreductase [Rhizobium populisoli]
MTVCTARRGLAVITGASSGIGFELAKCAAGEGFDLIIAADEPEIEEAAAGLRTSDFTVDTVQADLSTIAGVDRLIEYIVSTGWPIDLLMANAGRSLGHAFLDQDFDDARRVVDTNVTGTIYLVHQIGNMMRSRGEGRIMLTGSIAGFSPGPFQAVYNGTKAFINSFSFALRNELKDSGVSVTCLMPGVTETDIFRKADMLDTAINAQEKDDPADVARTGFDAMMNGEGDVVSGWKNKLQTAVANVTPAGALAAQHRKLTEPGSAPK